MARNPPLKRWKWLAPPLAVAAVLLVSGSHSGVAASRPLITGLSGVEGTDPLAYHRVHAAGAGFVRVSVPWQEVAPAERPSSWDPRDPADPAYSWGTIDREIEEAVGAGLVPLVQIDNGPTWAQRCKPPPIASLNVCDTEPAALADFAVAAARRYSGHFGRLPRVRYWQGLNEPNLSIYFNPQYGKKGKPVSAGIYRRLINAFYGAIKSVDHSNLVLAAGLGPIGIPHIVVGPLRFTRELLCMKGRRRPHAAPGGCRGGVHFDIFAIHPYTTGGPYHEGHPDDVELGDLHDLRALLNAADRAGRIKGSFRRTPLWITEFSWDSKPPDPGGLRMGLLARWTAVAMYRAWQAGVSHFFWYGLRDFPREGRPYDETLQSGLYTRGATLKRDRPKRPLISAFRFPFVAFGRRDGFAYWGRTPAGAGGVAIEVRHGGGWRRVTRVRAGGDGIFSGRVHGAFGRNGRGHVRARFRKQLSLPFSLHEVKDFPQPPFG